MNATCDVDDVDNVNIIDDLDKPWSKLLAKVSAKTTVFQVV